MASSRSSFTFKHIHHRSFVNDINLKISRLHLNYLPINVDKTFEKQKKIALKELRNILKLTDREILQNSDIKEVIQACLITCFYFNKHIIILPKKISFFQKRSYNKAIEAFVRTINFLVPEMMDVVLSNIFSFITEANWWDQEVFIIKMIEVILKAAPYEMRPLWYLLQDVKRCMNDDEELARKRMRVVVGIVSSESFYSTHESLIEIITFLLTLFDNRKDGEDKIHGSHLQKSFDLCFRKIFENCEVENRVAAMMTILYWYETVELTKDEMLEFTNQVESSVPISDKNVNYDKYLEDSCVKHLLTALVESEDHLESMLGCRLLRFLLDRNHNANFLKGPIIFRGYLEVNLVVGNLDKSDFRFILKHRARFHDCVMSAVHRHASVMPTLNSVYSLVCCLVLEIPCGFTAAEAAWIALAMQDFSILEESLPSTVRIWLHAIVVSILSLVCFIHKAKELQEYVEEVITTREAIAQQLNPPIRSQYTPEEVAVLDKDNKDLFFEEWEIKYRIWKHFFDTPQDNL